MKLILALIMVLLFPVLGWSFTLTQTGVNVQVTYTEPTTQESLGGPTPLNDLASTDISVIDSGTVVQFITVPASAPTGGGSISQDVVVDVQAGEEKTYTFSVVATDLNGNVSTPAEQNILIDRIPPSPVN